MENSSSYYLTQKGGIQSEIVTPNKSKEALNQRSYDRLQPSNYLARRATNHKRVQKVYCGTEDMVSPQSYRLNQLTGGKNVAEGKYRQGPMVNFGKEDTGRSPIRNKHTRFFTINNFTAAGSQRYIRNHTPKSISPAKGRVDQVVLNPNTSTHGDQKVS